MSPGIIAPDEVGGADSFELMSIADDADDLVREPMHSRCGLDKSPIASEGAVEVILPPHQVILRSR